MALNDVPLLQLDHLSVLNSWDRMGGCYMEDDLFLDDIDAVLDLDLDSLEAPCKRFSAGFDTEAKRALDEDDSDSDRRCSLGFVIDFVTNPFSEADCQLNHLADLGAPHSPPDSILAWGNPARIQVKPEPQATCPAPGLAPKQAKGVVPSETSSAGSSCQLPPVITASSCKGQSLTMVTGYMSEFECLSGDLSTEGAGIVPDIGTRRTSGSRASPLQSEESFGIVPQQTYSILAALRPPPVPTPTITPKVEQFQLAMQGHMALPAIAAFSDACMGLNLGSWDGMSRARREGLQRYRAKKARRMFTKKIRYQLRKINADKRPRIKGRFVKKGQAMDMDGSSTNCPLPAVEAAISSDDDDDDLDL